MGWAGPFSNTPSSLTLPRPADSPSRSPSKVEVTEKTTVLSESGGPSSTSHSSSREWGPGTWECQLVLGPQSQSHFGWGLGVLVQGELEQSRVHPVPSRGEPPCQWPGPCGRDSHSPADRAQRAGSQEDTHKAEHPHYLRCFQGNSSGESSQGGEEALTHHCSPFKPVPLARCPSRRTSWRCHWATRPLWRPRRRTLPETAVAPLPRPRTPQPPFQEPWTPSPAPPASRRPMRPHVRTFPRGRR